MTPRSVKRADILDRRRAGRAYRRNARPVTYRAAMTDRSIRTTIQRQLDALDALNRKYKPIAATDAAEPVDVARRRLLCLVDGCNPVSDRGVVPGATCVVHEDWPELSGIYSSCDDGEGYCPAPDCKYYGPCVCVCHREETP